MYHLQQCAISIVSLTLHVHGIMLCTDTIFLPFLKVFNVLPVQGRRKSWESRCPLQFLPSLYFQYLCFTIMCLFPESWRFWSSSDKFHFRNVSTQAESVFTKGVICTELRNKSQSRFLQVSILPV